MGPRVVFLSLISRLLVFGVFLVLRFSPVLSIFFLTILPSLLILLPASPLDFLFSTDGSVVLTPVSLSSAGSIFASFNIFFFSFFFPFFANIDLDSSLLSLFWGSSDGSFTFFFNLVDSSPFFFASTPVTFLPLLELSGLFTDSSRSFLFLDSAIVG